MADAVIDNPILNSPFGEPSRHWRFGDTGITNEIVEGRRSSSYFMPISRSEVTRRSISSRCRAQYLLGMELHVVFEPDEEGWVRASIEELPGVITCAPTRDEARRLIRDALDEWLAALTSIDRATTGLDGTRETLTVSVT